MREIILWYSRNSKKIWGMIGFLAIIIIVIQFFQLLTVRIESKPTVYMGTENKENLNTVGLSDDKSTITGQTLTNNQKKLLETIDKFMEYCNNKQLEQAYSLLSEDCKSEMYTSIDKFEKNYYNNIFKDGNKKISAENWVNNIYKVKIFDDPLATGKYNSGSSIQDYISIIEDEQKNVKLNINGYIKKEKINTYGENDSVKINVIEKHKYMDYEIYVFEITNNTKDTILLQDLKSINSMYLQDKNNIKYTAYLHEISGAELKILSGEKRTIRIKYYNKFGSNKQIQRIVFPEIILNYSIYQKLESVDKHQYYTKIQINL